MGLFQNVSINVQNYKLSAYMDKTTYHQKYYKDQQVTIKKTIKSSLLYIFSGKAILVTYINVGFGECCITNN